MGDLGAVGDAIGASTAAERMRAAEAMRGLVIEAGAAIMRYFRGEAALEADRKEDDSPVTAADRAADAILTAGLAAAFPGAPIVTEERRETHEGDPGSAFFLIDPLDGTQEFIAGGAEFTVNIALIEGGAPRLGAVFAPALGRLFWTPDPDFAVEEMVSEAGETTLRGRLWVAPPPPGALRVLASRAYRTAETDAYIARCAAPRVASVSSSLKFCLIAAGEADLYPRLGPSMAWDTAAAHAVLRAAGGRVRVLGPDDAIRGPLRYGPEAAAQRSAEMDEAAPLDGRLAYANPHFVAYAPGAPLP